MHVFVLLQALASTLDSSDIQDLRDQFNAIDIDRNGTITLEEMRDVSVDFTFFTFVLSLV